MCRLPHPIPSVRALTTPHVVSVQACNFDGVGWSRSCAETVAYYEPGTANGANDGWRKRRLPVPQSTPLLPRSLDVELGLALKFRRAVLPHIKR